MFCVSDEDGACSGTQARMRDVHDDGRDRTDGSRHDQTARDQQRVLGRARGEQREGRAKHMRSSGLTRRRAR